VSIKGAIGLSLITSDPDNPVITNPDVKELPEDVMRILIEYCDHDTKMQMKMATKFFNKELASIKCIGNHAFNHWIGMVKKSLKS
jgi:hypothetical protein